MVTSAGLDGSAGVSSGAFGDDAFGDGALPRGRRLGRLWRSRVASWDSDGRVGPAVAVSESVSGCVSGPESGLAFERASRVADSFLRRACSRRASPGLTRGSSVGLACETSEAFTSSFVAGRRVGRSTDRGARRPGGSMASGTLVAGSDAGRSCVGGWLVGGWLIGGVLSGGAARLRVGWRASCSDGFSLREASPGSLAPGRGVCIDEEASSPSRDGSTGGGTNGCRSAGTASAAYIGRVRGSSVEPVGSRPAARCAKRLKKSLMGRSTPYNSVDETG